MKHERSYSQSWVMDLLKEVVGVRVSAEDE